MWHFRIIRTSEDAGDTGWCVSHYWEGWGCPRCGHENDDVDRWCFWCRWDRRDGLGALGCPDCNYTNAESASACSCCGREL